MKKTEWKYVLITLGIFWIIFGFKIIFSGVNEDTILIGLGMPILIVLGLRYRIIYV